MWFNFDSIFGSEFKIVYNNNLLFYILLVLIVVFIFLLLFRGIILHILFYLIIGIGIYLCLFHKDVIYKNISSILKSNNIVTNVDIKKV